MFNGIIRQLGKVQTLRYRSGNLYLELESSLSKKLKIGDSVAVNGVCQTVIKHSAKTFSVEVMPETLRLTNLGNLQVGQVVNLERPLSLTSLLDGHLVSGHVDGVGKLVEIKPDGQSKLLTFNFPATLKKFISHKGSVAINGISLTIIKPIRNTFTVSIVGHTWENTNLSKLRLGQKVNLEVDLLARYLFRLLKH